MFVASLDSDSDLYDIVIYMEYSKTIKTID